MQISKIAHSCIEKIELRHWAALSLRVCCMQRKRTKSPLPALATFRTMLLLVALLWPVASASLSVRAQEIAEPPTSIQIMDVDSTYLPHTSISVFSTDLPMDMLRLPVQIIEVSGAGKNVVQEFQTYPDYIGAQRIVIVNTEKLDRVGMGGRSHRSNIESIVREIYDHPTVFSNIDWMSAYALVRDGDATQIAEWNRNKGNYFIDLVTFDFESLQKRPAQTATPVQIILDALQQEGDSGSDTDELSLTVGLDSVQIPEGAKPQNNEDLSSVFQRFNTLPPNSLAVKSVIVFTDSAEQIFSAVGRSSLSSVTRYAQRNQIYVHAVHLAHDPVQEDVHVNQDLKTLVGDTGGVYVHYQSASDLLPLWTRLNEEKQRTKLVYQPSGPQVKSISVQVTLPDGTHETSQEYSVSFPLDNIPADEGGIAAIATAESQAATANGAAVNIPLPAEVVSTGSSTSWLASLFGLSQESTTLEKGTLLILWSLSLGLLFFLIFPEIARGWRLFLKFQHKLMAQSRQRFSLLTAGPSSAEHPLVPAFPSPNSNGYSNGHILNGSSLNGHTANGHTTNGKSPTAHSTQPHSERRNGSSENLASDSFVSKNGSGANGHPYRHQADYGEDDGDATEIQYPVMLGEIGRLLRITYDDGLPEEVPIQQVNQSDGNEVAMYIGRDNRRNTIIIPDSKKRISREHAVLILERGLLYLADNSSIGGTFLNRVRLEPSDRKLLRDGDRIGLGGVEYQIQLQSEEATVVNLQRGAKE